MFKPYKSLIDFVKEEDEKLKQLNVVSLILSSPDFVLTGSRFFGNTIDGESDYDYFIKESVFNDKYRDILYKNGCKPMLWISNGYSDRSVRTVYEFTNLIDIQVIKDVFYDAKFKTNQYLKKTFDLFPTLLPVFKGYPTSIKRNIWTASILGYMKDQK